MRFDPLKRLRQLAAISRPQDIARRYFVVNGFDGALTTLGILIGFYTGKPVDLNVVTTACVSAAIGLGMSGFSSAYVSEVAERKKEFRQLQEAMISDLSTSAHYMASRWMPLLIALVNGITPLLISLIIIVPLWLAELGIVFQFGPFESAIVIAFIIIFLLGLFLSSISETFWLLSGLQTVVIAIITGLLIYLIA